MRRFGALALEILIGACSDGADKPSVSMPVPSATRDELLDPETCKGCHPRHYREWASSMHAYAGEDPVFLAMNRRGQRETNGTLGEFCVRCHAPMALREGMTQNGLNLAELPSKLRGVTCYFCHNAVSVGEPFNNHVELANDTTLRGAIVDPVPNGVHSSAYSPFQDRNRADASQLCGGCHDVVTPGGVTLERTYREYQESLYATEGPGFDTCSGCHMPGIPGAVALGAEASTKQRTRHEHLWPGVDTALTPFPDQEAQRHAVECELSLGTRIYDVVQDDLGGLRVRVETQAGHHQPSGTSLDRRLWLELIAYDAAGAVVFESGHLDDHELEQKPVGSSGYDPQLALFRDWIYDAQGNEAHMFWEAAPSTTYPDGYASLTLPAPLTPGTAHTLEANYEIPGFARVDRIGLRLRMRPIGIDVLQNLLASGDLEAAVLDQLQTFTLYGAAGDYSPNTRTLTPQSIEELRCPDSYRCLLDPDNCGS